MKRIRGKQAFVTGAASGIGRAIALSLAEQGADLFLVDINKAGLDLVAEEASSLRSNVAVCRADLRVPGDIHAAIEAYEAIGTDLGILVNSAGLTYIGATEFMTEDQQDELLAVNLRAPIQLTLELLPLLLAADESHILNVCSFGGLVPHLNQTVYSSTKYGLVGFSESLRIEYRGTGLGVTALCPGMVRTKMRVMVPPGEQFHFPKNVEWLLTSPEKVARAAISAIRRNRGIVVGAVTPHSLWLLNRLFPAGFDWLHRRFAES